MKDVLHRIRQRLSNRLARTSYAQCGEDLIVRYLLLEVLGRKELGYLDIGAHDPWFLSNTALFYRMGFRGVLVEPDAALCRNLRRHRGGDICVNAGIGDGSEAEADFYVLSARTLSTLSKEAAERCATDGHRIERVVRVPLVAVNALIQEHFPRGLAFVSVDVEGLDEQILRSLDFTAHRPDVVCVETARHHSERREWRKNESVPAFMREQRYFAYADTFINTIFVNQDIW